MKIFTTEKKLAASWDLLPISARLLIKNFWLLTILVIVATIASSLSADYSDPNDYGLVHVLGFLGSVWLIVFAPAYAYAQLRIVRQKTPAFGEVVKESSPYFWRTIGSMILVGLIVFGGLLLLIVPGLIFIRRYCLTPYYVIDKNVSIREALRMSSAATKPVSAYIWGTLLITILIAIATSALLLIPLIGIFVAGVAGFIYTFALTIRYLELEHPAEAKKLLKTTTPA